MRKIRLDMDALAVESFPTDGAARDRSGTVRAHQEPLDVPTLETGYHGCYACPATVACVGEVPTLETGHHGCYGCPATVLTCLATCPCGA